MRTLQEQAQRVYDAFWCRNGLDNTNLVDELNALDEVLAAPSTVWITYRCSDMTEGRGGMVAFGPAYSTEQAAWDAVNYLGGVMGCHPSTGCYPAAECKEFGLDTWQKYDAHFKAKGLKEYGDYAVRPMKVEK